MNNDNYYLLENNSRVLIGQESCLNLELLHTYRGILKYSQLKEVITIKENTVMMGLY
jgi:hypothetical protein